MPEQQMTPTRPTELEALNGMQQARVVALRVAREVLVPRSVVGSGPADGTALVAVASWIVTGDK